MKATKLPSGNWRVRVYIGEVDGLKKFKSITAGTKREAERLAMQYAVTEKDTLPLGDCTVAEAVERYISNRTAVLSPSTIRGYRSYQRTAFTPINDHSVRSATSETLQAFINDYALRHSPKTTRNVYGLLISAMRSAAPEKSFSVRLPQKEVLTYNIPVDEEVKLLMDAAPPNLRKAIILASVGTLRRSEICALEYSDITGNVIHVHRAVVEDEHNHWVVKDIPKNSSSDRYVEFPAAVIREFGNKEGRLVTCSPTAITNGFCKLKAKLGIDTRFHDLRHYAASIMHAIGVPDQYIMERGGWSSDTVLKGVYRNVLADKRNEFTDRTNGYMEKFF